MFTYKTKPIEKVKADYYRRTRDKKSGFKDVQAYVNWYLKQDKKCFYCGIMEHEVQEIVTTGLLESKRFPENGILKRGKSRGVWLEVDRKHPESKYSENNCVLACYFCNNDKSDVFKTSEAYMQFKANRSGYLRDILNNAKTKA